MAQLNIPNLLVQGTTINAAPFNANFNAVAVAVNSIDNSNMGAAGIFASQIIPTTSGQAIFGGTAGYTFPSASSGQPSLTVNSASAGASSLSVNTSGSSGVGLFVGSGTSGNLLQVAANFVVSSAGATLITTSGVAVTPLTVNMLASQSAPGLLINGAASITGNLLQVDFTAGGTHAFIVDQNGAARFAEVGGGNMPNLPSIVGSSAGGLIFNNTTAQSFFYTSGSSAANGLATINGTSGAYTATSDARLKENVVDLSLGLAELLQLRPVSYDWISTKAPGQGFIAQEVQKFVPNAVSVVNADGSTLGISDALLTPVVVKAIQQLNAKVDAYIAAHP